MERYIGKCLDSIVCSGIIEDVEVIVIDDGATDSSGDIADSYALKCPYIRVIHKVNAGVAAARNTGIENARGEYEH